MNYIWSLFNNGIITRPILSFSMASSDIDDQPYALFGGFNSSQIVGGEKGLQTFKNNPGNYKSNMRSWALDIKDFLYDSKSLRNSDRRYPAVIDTGSSFVAVPPEEYKALRDKWKTQVDDHNCESDPTFCSSRLNCEQLAKKISPVSFQIGETLFHLKPMGYLHQGEGICQFAIAQNPLDRHNNGNFLFGGLFLKHFYSVYDYDRELISLGVNRHSKDLVSMQQLEHAKLRRPGETARSSAEADEMQTEAESSYTAAAESEKLAGKVEPQGIKSLDGKLDRTVLDNNSDDIIEEVMKKSDKKREVLKKKPTTLNATLDANKTVVSVELQANQSQDV